MVWPKGWMGHFISLCLSPQLLLQCWPHWWDAGGVLGSCLPQEGEGSGPAWVNAHLGLLAWALQSRQRQIYPDLLEWNLERQVLLQFFHWALLFFFSKSGKTATWDNSTLGYIYLLQMYMVLYHFNWLLMTVLKIIIQGCRKSSS